MSKARCRPIFRTMAMGAAMVAFTGAASADDLLATLSLDMSPETAWPIAPASTDESVTADSSAPAPVIPPAAAPAPANPPAAASAPASPPEAASAPQNSPTPPAQKQAAQTLPARQLNQLVAPIALYPDPLLSQVLMAATYPVEVVEAARWVQAHKRLKGEALANALKGQSWDPSVKGLVAFPRVLADMSDRLTWTQQLGNAFLAQQADVMKAVQTLRHEAMAAGNLKQTPQCRCVIKTEGETISILPSATEVVCVPVYNPRVVYGPWPEPAYPPYAFPVPVGFAFDPGYPIAFYPPIEVAVFGPFWGWSWFNWGGGFIAVDPVRFAFVSGGHPAFAGGRWIHDPARRGGFARGAAFAAVGRSGFARGGAGRAAFAGMHGSTVGHGEGMALHAGASAARVGHGFRGRGGWRAGGWHGMGWHGGGAFRGGPAFRGPMHAAHFGGRGGGFPGGGGHGGHGGGGDHHH